LKGDYNKGKRKQSFLSRGRVSEGQWTELGIKGVLMKKRGQLARVEESLRAVKMK
jgi:hypothetical protein